MSALPQELPEINEYPPNAAIGLLQQPHKRDGFDYLRFVDGYLDKKVHILVRFRRCGVDENFLALVQRECAGDRNKLVGECLFELFGIEYDLLRDGFISEN